MANYNSSTRAAVSITMPNTPSMQSDRTRRMLLSGTIDTAARPASRIGAAILGALLGSLGVLGVSLLGAWWTTDAAFCVQTGSLLAVAGFGGLWLAVGIK